jgi:sugar lactone lactonase YvrE
MRAGTWLVSIFLLTSSSLHGADRSVTSYAGSGSMGHHDASHNSAAFAYPTSLCNAGGVIYVADAVNHVIRRIDRDGVSTLAGVAGIAGYSDGAAASATFNFPQGIACTSFAVFVADSGNATIRKIENGFVTTLAGTAREFGTRDAIGTDARFIHPVSVAVDVDGSILVADSSAHNIRRIRSDNLVETIAGNAGEPGHHDGRGTLARFAEPWGIAIDPRGMIFVADRGNNVIRQIDANRVVTTYAGVAETSGARDGDRRTATFFAPVAIHALPDGSMLIADSWNHTIRMIDSAGAVSTLAGSGTAGFANGEPGRARFDYPLGVTADDGGNVYIADMLNHRIRSLTAVKSGRRRSVRP